MTRAQSESAELVKSWEKGLTDARTRSDVADVKKRGSQVPGPT